MIKHTIIYTALLVPGMILLRSAGRRHVKLLVALHFFVFTAPPPLTSPWVVSTIPQGIIFLWLTDRGLRSGQCGPQCRRRAVEGGFGLTLPGVVLVNCGHHDRGFNCGVCSDRVSGRRCKGVPAELHEAASIDGASAFTLLPHHHRAPSGAVNLFLLGRPTRSTSWTCSTRCTSRS